jgi:hypothetical protein
MTIKAQTGPGTVAERVHARPLPPPLDSPQLPDLRRLATLSAGLLLIDDARLYGLIDSGPDVDRGRCADVLERARRHEIVVDDDEVAAAAVALMAELGVLRA